MFCVGWTEHQFGVSSIEFTEAEVMRVEFGGVIDDCMRGEEGSKEGEVIIS